MNKNLIIFGIVALFICIEFSGCLESDNIKTIEIDGMEVTQTVNYLEKPVKFIVDGMDCDITVTKETKLNEVIINGMDSIVRVSRSHSFTSTIKGMDSEIVFYD